MATHLSTMFDFARLGAIWAVLWSCVLVGLIVARPGIGLSWTSVVPITVAVVAAGLAVVARTERLILLAVLLSTGAAVGSLSIATLPYLLAAAAYVGAMIRHTS